MTIRIDGKKMMKATIVAIGIILGTLAATPAGAAESADPLNTVKGPVEEVLQILKDPQYKDGQNRIQQQEEIHTIAKEVFDFVEIAKRALARNWKKFTPDERRQFTERFTDLLLNTYTRKIQGTYADEQVVFLEQQMLSDTKASVKSTINREGLETPVNYSVLNKKGNWRIYDIQIEGVSLVGNYRTQFRKILAKETPAQLIARIEKKIESNEE